MNRWLEAAGMRLEWAHWGPEPDARPTIVLLHEGLGCLALWRDLPQRLVAATGFGVTACSRAGYGRSDPARLPRPLDYMTREAVETLPEVLAATGFRRGVLMGHSDGATIAAEYAGRVEDHRVRGLILMAPHFFAEPMGLTEIARAREAFAKGPLRDKMAKYHNDPDHTFRGWNDAWLDPGFEDWNVTEVIDHLRIPVLALQGRQDQYGSLAQLAELQNRSCAPVQVEVLENCRHAPHLEQPEATERHVAEFCARLEWNEARPVER